jgi:hypothetical protein
MNKLIIGSVAVVALLGPALAVAAAPGDQTPPASQAREWRGEHGFMLDARIAGMKAALKLTADQEKLWTPFETAVRDAAKARFEARRAEREAMKGDERPSPIDRLTTMSDRLEKASTNLKAIAGAAKPLYDSLDDTQKHEFGPLLASLRDRGPQGGPHEGMAAQWRHHDGGERQ